MSLYKRLYQDSVSQTSDVSSNDGENEISISHSRLRRSHVPALGSLLCTVLITAALTFWVTLSIAKDRVVVVETGTDDLSIDVDSQFSLIDRSYHTAIWPAWNWTSSPYTQPPNGEEPEDNKVDKLWDELGVNANFFGIPVSEGAQYGLSPARNVILPHKINGEDHYIAVLEMVHQLHCLNVIRRNTWYNNPWYMKHWAHIADRSDMITHINHCIDMLRHRISCTADIGIVPWIYIDAAAGSKYPQFDRPHKCRNPQPLIDYTFKHERPEAEKHYDFVPPPNAIVEDWRHYYGKEELEKLHHGVKGP